ncbi:MAG: EamA family transporter, partial [Tissierellia bacterium]|nr:EamA family transporter [Tissierellia bacterium]
MTKAGSDHDGNFTNPYGRNGWELFVGSVTGPYIGVVLSLVALQYTAAGIVSSISSISPILIIPASIVIFKEKVLPK